MKLEIIVSKLSFHELLMQDTKNGILESFKALGIKVPKSLRKAELAEMLATIFEEKPLYHQPVVEGGSGFALATGSLQTG